MNRKNVGAILEELSNACQESHDLFSTWADKSTEEEERQLLSYRANRYADNQDELEQIRERFGDMSCNGPELQASPESRWAVLRKRIAGMAKRDVLRACEAQDSRVLVMYRDSFEYELPVPVAFCVARQFGELIDHHARLQRLQAAATPSTPAGRLALSAQV